MSKKEISNQEKYIIGLMFETLSEYNLEKNVTLDPFQKYSTEFIIGKNFSEKSLGKDSKESLFIHPDQLYYSLTKAIDSIYLYQKYPQLFSHKALRRLNNLLEFVEFPNSLDGLNFMLEELLEIEDELNLYLDSFTKIIKSYKKKGYSLDINDEINKLFPSEFKNSSSNFDLIYPKEQDFAPKSKSPKEIARTNIMKARWGDSPRKITHNSKAIEQLREIKKDSIEKDSLASLLSSYDFHPKNVQDAINILFS